MREHETLSELAAKYEVSPVMISRWKKEFIDNSAAAFETPKKDDKEMLIMNAKKFQQLNVGTMNIIKKFYLMLLLVISCSMHVMAQTDFYYYNGKKIPLALNENKVVVSIPKDSVKTIESIRANVQVLFDIKDVYFDVIVISRSDFNKLTSLDSWEENSKSVIITSCYFTEGNDAVCSSPYLNVKLKKKEDMALLNSYAERYRLRNFGSFSQNLPLWIILSLTPESEKSPLQCANELYESGYFEHSVPDLCSIPHEKPPVIDKSVDTLLYCGFAQGESNYVINNTAIRPDGSTDEVRVVTDETGAYLRWKAGGSMYGAVCNPEDVSLTLGGFNLESGQRYAVDFTFCANVGGDMTIGIYHRTPDGLEPVNGPGISPDGFLDFCYHFDYINRYRVMFMSGWDYEDCCLRFSFLSPGVTYEIDNIALLESVFCDVSYNGDIAKIKFTPDNNLSELASLAPEGAVEIPSDCISLEAEYDGEPYGLDVMTAEYHDDGCLYVWLDDDSFEGLEKISFSFHNPVDDPSIALKYIKEIDSATNDTVWALFPDLIQQRAFHNPEVYVTSHGKISWLVTSNLFDYKNTDAPSDLDSITMSFRSALAPDFEESITAQLVSADGWSYSEPWHVSDYIVDVDNDDNEIYTVVFRPDSLNNQDNKQLPGKYIFKLGDVRFWSACQHIMTDYSVSVYFSGTNSIDMKAEAEPQKEENRHYSPDGRMITAGTPGFHIIRLPDGRIRKAYVPIK